MFSGPNDLKALIARRWHIPAFIALCWPKHCFTLAASSLQIAARTVLLQCNGLLEKNNIIFSPPFSVYSKMDVWKKIHTTSKKKTARLIVFTQRGAMTKSKPFKRCIHCSKADCSLSGHSSWKLHCHWTHSSIGPSWNRKLVGQGLTDRKTLLNIQLEIKIIK